MLLPFIYFFLYYLVFSLVLNGQQNRHVVVDAFAFCIFFSLSNIFFNKLGYDHCHQWLLNGKYYQGSALCLYVYAPSTLACSLNIFQEKKKNFWSSHRLIKSDRVSPQKKGASRGLVHFLFEPKNSSSGGFKTGGFGLGQ